MNDDKSFIKLHRKMLKWEWYNDINTKVLFIHLLLIANWEDKKWEGNLIKRGQVVTGRKKLSKETGLTEQQIRTSINKLISTNEITTETTNKYTVVTIVKYEDYQQTREKITNEITNKSTFEQPTNNQQVTTTKEYKEIKEYKENNNNTTIYDFVQQNFGRVLSPAEYEEISSWNDNELTRYAIKQSVLSNKCVVKYISRILNAYERENIKTVQQAQERERQYIEAKKNKVYNNSKGKTPVVDKVLKEIYNGTITIE